MNERKMVSNYSQNPHYYYISHLLRINTTTVSNYSQNPHYYYNSHLLTLLLFPTTAKILIIVTIVTYEHNTTTAVLGIQHPSIIPDTWYLSSTW